MSEPSRELTVGDVVALSNSARKVLGMLGHEVDGKFSSHTIRERIRKMSEETMELDQLVMALMELRGAIVHFEQAPAGIGRASAGKR